MLLWPTYKMLSEGLNEGQTLGKKVFGFRVAQANADYTAIGPSRAFKRFLFYLPLPLMLLCSFLIQWYYRVLSWHYLFGVLQCLVVAAALLCVVAILSIFTNVQRRTWYDRFAGTICVEVNQATVENDKL
jgi:uncharacterized RDD family membrane protein YckC